jgi:serine/threonine-protein kinase HipA
VRDPQAPLDRIAEAMADTLHATGNDPRIPTELLVQLRLIWENGIRHDP